jgi:hypothetical protein
MPKNKRTGATNKDALRAAGKAQAKKPKGRITAFFTSPGATMCPDAHLNHLTLFCW